MRLSLFLSFSNLINFAGERAALLGLRVTQWNFECAQQRLELFPKLDSTCITNTTLQEEVGEKEEKAALLCSLNTFCANGRKQKPLHMCQDNNVPQSSVPSFPFSIPSPRANPSHRPKQTHCHFQQPPQAQAELQSQLATYADRCAKFPVESRPALGTVLPHSLHPPLPFAPGSVTFLALSYVPRQWQKGQH